MLDVHPAHHAATTWRDFFIHIATIVIGLLIAVGLEQTVEAIHHYRQRAELREQILEVLNFDLKVDATDQRQLSDCRSFLVEQQAAIIARRAGKNIPAGPPRTDPRMKISPAFPSLAPYEAAKQSSTVTVLPANEIRLFNRIELQRDLLLTDVHLLYETAHEWESFAERFTDSPGNPTFGVVIVTPDLNQLSPVELIEYQAIIAKFIKEIDVVVARLHYFDVECHSVLNGNRDENKIFEQLDFYNAHHSLDDQPATPDR
jgi:hypothetical protein